MRYKTVLSRQDSHHVRNYSADIAEELFIYLVQRLPKEKKHMILIFVIVFFYFFAPLLFSISESRLPSHTDTFFRCGRKIREQHEMGSFRMKAKESLAASPGTSQAIQSNEIDIVNHGEAPVIFEDFVKASKSVPYNSCKPQKQTVR